jgi:hypothetical protein
MFTPALYAWIEQWRQGSLYRVNRREIRTFAQIAFHTSERQILFLSASSVFERNHVVNMVYKDSVILMQQAILAVSFCSLYNQSA